VRPRRAAPPSATGVERAAIRRHTWKVLLIGVCANVVGAGIRLVTVRTAGAMPRARLAAPEGRLQEIGKLSAPSGVGK